MDNPTRLKTRIGEHEFDAEGSAEYVREQFQVWQEMVKLAISAANAVHAQRGQDRPSDEPPAPPKQDAATIDSGLQKILRVDNRSISLTARSSSVHDAILLMLYGQKTLRNNEAVTGGELLSGISATGGYAVSRLDRILDALAEGGDVMAFGERRGKRYRLTNTGIAKARQLAADLIATVA